jgi:hypothetical protein
MMDETKVIELLESKGPLTGAELLNETAAQPLDLWRFCLNNPQVAVRVLGRRYLRLDRVVEGYARLSPSIRREFLTYTLLDLQSMDTRLEARAEELAIEITRVSDYKRRLSQQIVTDLVEALPEKDRISSQSCFILGGDITYNMAHSVPRPERSTGKLVRGSDLDIIVVTENFIDPAVVTMLDEAVYQKKHRLLNSPSYREELDYIIKNMATVERQVAFDTFEHMVACKILCEGEFLYGSTDIMDRVRSLLVRHEVPKKVAALEKRAVEFREKAVDTLCKKDGEVSGSHYLNLFFTSDESDEIY